MEAGVGVVTLEQQLVADVDGSVASLYLSEAAALLGMLWMYIGDRAAAEDLVQEAFVRVHRAWHRIDDPSRAAAYLRSVAFNLARSRWRRLRVAARHVNVEQPTPSAETSALLADDRSQVVAALSRLPTRQRECLLLRYYAGSSDAATAATLGISVNSVKTHVRRGLTTVEGQSAGRVHHAASSAAGPRRGVARRSRKRARRPTADRRGRVARACRKKGRTAQAGRWRWRSSSQTLARGWGPRTSSATRFLGDAWR